MRGDEVARLMDLLVADLCPGPETVNEHRQVHISQQRGAQVIHERVEDRRLV